MNRDCHGDVLKIRGKVYYRCLMDSTLVRIDDRTEPRFCPNCNRQTGVESWEPVKVKTRTVVQYHHPDHWWMPFDPKESENVE